MRRVRTRTVWLARRLAAMSAAEIAHRVGEQAQRSLSRFDRRDWSRLAAVAAPLPVLPGLVEVLHAMAPSPGLRQAWRDVADRPATGRWLMLAAEWPRS